MNRDKAGRQRQRAYGHDLPDGQTMKTSLGQVCASENVVVMIGHTF